MNAINLEVPILGQQAQQQIQLAPVHDPINAERITMLHDALLLNSAITLATRQRAAVVGHEENLKQNVADALKQVTDWRSNIAELLASAKPDDEDVPATSTDQ